MKGSSIITFLGVLIGIAGLSAALVVIILYVRSLVKADESGNHSSSFSCDIDISQKEMPSRPTVATGRDRSPVDQFMESSLLAWMNSFPELQSLGITNFVDFRDGFGIAILWNLFGTPQIDLNSLQQPSGATSWIAWMKNLRAIDQVIAPTLTAKGIRESCDLAAIARKGQVEDLIKFVKPLVFLSLSSPLKKEIIQRIRTLSPAAQRGIREIIESYQARKSASPAVSAAATINEVKNLQDQIGQLESQLRDLETESQRIQKKSERERERLVTERSKALSFLLDENEEIKQDLEGSRLRKSQLKGELLAMKLRISKSDSPDFSRKVELKNGIAALEGALAEFAAVNEKLSLVKRECEETRTEIAVLDRDISEGKDDITTSIQLSQKYGAVVFDGEKIENELNETVAELANRISQMEIEIVVLKDAIESGQSGVPPDVISEHAKLKKVIARLMKKKKRSEEELEQKRQFNSELARMQKLMMDQRAEVEAELEKLTAEVNSKNIALTNWLYFSTAFDSWRQSSTFLSDVRAKYL